MDLFTYVNYRKFLKDRLIGFPKAGHGQAKKLAQFVGVSTAFISQVLAEIRHLTSEQGYLVSEFLSLSDLETKYFLKLMDIEKSGNYKHKKWLHKEIEQIRIDSKKISNRILYNKILSDQDKAIFYSDWYYSAIRMYCSIQPQNIISLMNLTGLPRKVITESTHFLLNSGLILGDNDHYVIGPQSTHLGADSPWVSLHHANWRRKALENVKLPSELKVHYTSPMTLSKADAEKIQSFIHKVIEDIGKIVDPSPSETLMCLNIDWFEVNKFSD